VTKGHRCMVAAEAALDVSAVRYLIVGLHTYWAPRQELRGVWLDAHRRIPRCAAQAKLHQDHDGTFSRSLEGLCPS
jgi:hypothetical protein